MKAWRALLLMSALLLSGCLVSFSDPIPANEPAPMPLLGLWDGQDEWGERVYLDITRAGSNLYRAVYSREHPDNPQGRQEFGFTVAHHGRRWYLSAGLPRKYGANFAIAGFELTTKNELILYTLDVERVLQEVQRGGLEGHKVDLVEADGVLISSPLEKVFAYLDDPAHSDVFIEFGRYQRAAE
jgi:hypothetical protein